MMKVQSTSHLGTARFWLAVSLLLSLIPAVQAQTVIDTGARVVKLDFSGGIGNNGTASNPAYVSLAPELWEKRDERIPALGDALLSVDNNAAIMLTRGQAVEFDEETTGQLISSPNNKLRFSMRFKVQNLIENPNPKGEHRIPLFSFMNSWYNEDEQGRGIGLQVIFQRQSNGKGKVLLVGRDGTPFTGTGNTKYIPLFRNVDIDAWQQLDFVLDMHDETITARLNEQYFQLSLANQLLPQSLYWNNLLANIGQREGVRLRVGYHDPFNTKGNIFLYEAHLFVDEFIADNNTPEVSHEGYQNLLGDFADSLINPTTYNLDDLYVDKFLPYLVFATEGFYLDHNKTAVNEFRNTYETSNATALFSDRSTVLQLHKFPVLDRVLAILQHDIVVTHYNANDLADVAPLDFRSRESFPGVVAGIEQAPDSVDVYPQIHATYTEYPGVNRNSPAHRPTGYWARAGKLIQVCIPDTAAAAGADVIVGAHPPLKLSNAINRDYTITTAFKFNPDSGCTNVANPFGGGIYVRVPQDVQQGSIEVAISGAVVESPLFENRVSRLRPGSRKKSKNSSFQAWINEVSPLPPWTDYISNNVMFTVPTNAARLVDDGRAVMNQWDKLYQAVTLYQGYEDQRKPNWRPRPEYFVVDSVAYCGHCAGYWMSLPTWTAGQPIDSRTNDNGKWIYSHGLGVFNITKDPDFSRTRKFDHTLHEKGHNLRHAVNSSGEVESQANIIKLVGRTEVFGDSLEEALLYHNTQNLTLEEVTMEWMIMDRFLDIYSRADWRSRSDKTLPPLGTMNGRPYNSRPQIKYLDLARLYGGGWEAVGSIYKEFYKTDEWNDPTNFRKNTGDPAFVEMALRAFENQENTHLRGENPLPLLEFWGIIPPSEETSLQSRGNQLAQSDAIKERLEYYQSLVPEDKDAFYETYGHLINRRGAIATRSLFTNAWQNYETATFGPYVGYKAAIDARFAQIYEDYFDETTSAPAEPAADIDFRGQFGSSCNAPYSVYSGRHHVILCNDTGTSSAVIKSIKVRNSAGTYLFSRGLEQYRLFWQGAQFKFWASTADLTQATNPLTDKTITWEFTFLTDGVEHTCSANAAADSDKVARVRLNSATNCTVESK